MSEGSFLEALKTYLQRLTEGPSTSSSDSFDPAWARGLLLRTLERVERGESGKLELAEGATLLLEEWRTGDRVVVFAHQLARLLKQSLAPDASPSQLRDLIELGLARWFELPGGLSSRVQTFELDRLVKEAQKLAWQTSHVFVGLDIVRYAAANQLTVKTERRTKVSRLGQVLQNLEGRDAVRWLLQVEAHQALGTQDPDRLSRDSASAILEEESWPNIPELRPCNPATAERLCHLGVLIVEDDPDGYPHEWSVSTFGKELLGELVQRSPTPLALLVESLGSDMLSSAVQAVAGSSAGLTSSAAEATASQARMVAHEIRNALLPVQAALDSFYKEILLLPPREVIGRRRAIIDGGLKGALRFTKRLLQTAELGAKPPERFEPLQAVRDVIAELEGAPFVTLVTSVSEPMPVLLGRREHFTLAVRNIIDNAIQHGGSKLKQITINMTFDSADSVIRMIIDDDGQGVAESDRDHIFREGVTNKPGGTGLGLSWVKRVVEDEMRGIVVCSQSPAGGARFVVHLPLATPDHVSVQKEPIR